MFWQSVFNSLNVFLHWETYLATLIYLFITFLPFIFIALNSKNIEEINKTGCLLMLVQPLFQMLGVYVAVITLFPILLGGNKALWAAPWLMMIHDPWHTFIELIVILIITVLCTFIPILGQTNSFTLLIQGGGVFIWLLMDIKASHPEYGLANIDLAPGFWMIIGIVVISGITTWLGAISIGLLLTIFHVPESLSIYFTPVVSVVGFIPIFIYGSWISLQLQALK